MILQIVAISSSVFLCSSNSILYLSETRTDDRPFLSPCSFSYLNELIRERVRMSLAENGTSFLALLYRNISFEDTAWRK